MPLESVTHISDLVATNPTSTDPKSEGDNHLRNIKTALKTDFPNISGPVTKTHTQLNNALDKTGDTMTGPLAQAAGTAALPSYTFSVDTSTGMWSPVAGALAVSVGGVEAWRTNYGRDFLITGAGGLGYGAGSGGTVTQATSKATSVSLNKPCGQITMNNAALNAGASVVFVCNNASVGASDVVVGNIQLGSVTDAANYRLEVFASGTSGGARFAVRLTNVSGGSLSEAVVINFAIVKAATS